MGLNFDAAALGPLERVKKSSVDGGISCQLGQPLSIKFSAREIEQVVRGGI
jgi:hypothetical protein